MAARIVVFPVHGRQWAFGAVAPPLHSPGTAQFASQSLQSLWKNFRQANNIKHRAQLLTSYVSDKMHEKWIALGNAPQGSVRNRVHGIGQTLLARIKPSEIFLKSMARDDASLEIIYPSSLNPKLVRRRVRLLAMSGVQFHTRYMYGSFALLPLTALFVIVPVPNIPLFWNLFRAHAHWQALQGSKRLLQLVGDKSEPVSSTSLQSKTESLETGDSRTSPGNQSLVLSSSEILENMVLPMQVRTQAISNSTMAAICEKYHLDYAQMMRWRECEGK